MELDGKELEKLKELIPYKVLSPTPQEIIAEIERLKEDNKELGRLYSRANNEFLRLYSIIKEVREYIEKHTENIDRGRYYEDYVETYPILEILDKEGKWTNNTNGTIK